MHLVISPLFVWFSHAQKNWQKTTFLNDFIGFWISEIRIGWHLQHDPFILLMKSPLRCWVPKVHSVPCTSCTYPLCTDILVWNRRWTFKAQLCVYISCIFVTYIYIINLLDTKSAMILIRKIATAQFLDDILFPKERICLIFL